MTTREAAKYTRRRKHAKGKGLVPMVECPYCNAAAPCTLDEMYKPGTDIEVYIWSCANCETVLNLEEEPPIEWVSRRELIRRTGWKLVPDAARTTAQ